jgi:hypothetical protein
VFDPVENNVPKKTHEIGVQAANNTNRDDDWLNHNSHATRHLLRLTGSYLLQLGLAGTW